MNNLPIAFSLASAAGAKVRSVKVLGIKVRALSLWGIKGLGIMRVSQVGDSVAAVALVGVVAMAVAYQVFFAERLPDAPPPNVAAETGHIAVSPILADFADITASLTAREGPLPDETAPLDTPEKDQSRLDQEDTPVADYPYDATPSKRDLSFLRFYVYAEIPLDEKPADIVLETLKDVPVGTPVEEIKCAADAFRMNFSFMKAVAKIESDFDPKQRTGSYIGLFQLSHYEFAKYGSGDILSPRDNAIAAAYKFVAEATMFEWWSHRKPTISDLYLIHQQGWQGAAEHVAHRGWIAWKSMCATDEGKEKGEKWCKRAVWGNTLPAVKRIWKSVDNLTSGDFVDMWRQRLNMFYARYTQEADAEPKH